MGFLRSTWAYLGRWFRQPSSGRCTQCLLLVGAILFIACREPQYLVHPRIWAEEGSVYLASALVLPWWKALIAAHAGYFALVPNLATLLAARVFPLEWAAAVTTTFAFAVQLVPMAVIACGRSRCWPTHVHRLLAMAAILCSWNTDEIWLSTITSQFWLAATTFLLFLLNHRIQSARQHRVVCLLLVFCGLNGVLSLLLLPLYVVRALLYRRRWAIEQMLALLASAAVQIPAVCLSARGHQTLADARHFFGDRFFDFVFVRGVLRGFVHSNDAWQLMLHARSLTVLAFLCAFVLASRQGVKGTVTFVGLFLYAAIAMLGLAAQMTPAPRYFFLPSVVVVVLLVQAIQLPFHWRHFIPAARSVVGGVLLTMILVHTLPDYGPSTGEFFRRRWPRWTNEAASFRRQPSYHPRIHPCWSGCWKIDFDQARRE